MVAQSVGPGRRRLLAASLLLFVAARLSYAGIPGFSIAVVDTKAGAETDVRAFTVAPGGTVWYVDERYTPHHVASRSPAGQINRYPIPCDQCDQHTRLAYVEDLVIGPDGNIWLIGTHVNADGSRLNGGDNNYVWRMTPTGSFTTFKVPTVDAFRRMFFADAGGAITTGPDGNLWFTERLGNKIGRISTSGEITEFALPKANSYPLFIVTGPDGNVWFTQTRGAIGRISTSGSLSEFTVPASSSPHGLTTGADGNLWFTDWTKGIGRITPSGAIKTFAIPGPPSLPFDITSAVDGNLYLTFWTRDTPSSPSVARIGQIILSEVGTALERDKSFRDQAAQKPGLLNYVYIVPVPAGASALGKVRTNAESEIAFYVNGVLENFKHELNEVRLRTQVPELDAELTVDITELTEDEIDHLGSSSLVGKRVFMFRPKVRNVGTVTTPAGTLLYDMPPSMSIAAVSGYFLGVDSERNWFQYQVEPLAPQEAVSYRFFAVANVPAGTPVEITGTVTVAGDVNPANNTTTVIIAGGQASLRAAKYERSHPVTGKPEWVIEVRNVGGTATPGPIRVTEQPFAGVKLAVPQVPGYSCNGGGASIVCTSDGPLEAGGRMTFTFPIEELPGGAPAQNTATIEAVGLAQSTTVFDSISRRANPALLPTPDMKFSHGRTP